VLEVLELLLDAGAERDPPALVPAEQQEPLAEDAELPVVQPRLLDQREGLHQLHGEVHVAARTRVAPSERPEQVDERDARLGLGDTTDAGTSRARRRLRGCP
jgi:hypothetical protein